MIPGFGNLPAFLPLALRAHVANSVGGCAVLCRRHWAYPLCWFMGLKVSSFLLLSPGLGADVPKLGSGCVRSWWMGPLGAAPSEAEGAWQRFLEEEKKSSLMFTVKQTGPDLGGLS